MYVHTYLRTVAYLVIPLVMYCKSIKRLNELIYNFTSALLIIVVFAVAVAVPKWATIIFPGVNGNELVRVELGIWGERRVSINGTSETGVNATANVFRSAT